MTFNHTVPVDIRIEMMERELIKLRILNAWGYEWQSLKKRTIKATIEHILLYGSEFRKSNPKCACKLTDVIPGYLEWQQNITEDTITNIQLYMII